MVLPVFDFEEEKKYPKGSSHEMRLKALTEMVKQKERQAPQSREDASTAFISESMGDLATAASRPSITGVEIAAGVTPQAPTPIKSRFAQTLRADQAQEQKSLLDKYKTTNERARILRDYEGLDLKKAEVGAKKLKENERIKEEKRKEIKRDAENAAKAVERKEEKVEKRKDKWRMADENTYQVAMSKTRGMQRGSATNIGRIIHRNRLARDALRIIYDLESSDPGRLKRDKTIAAELAMAMASLLAAGSPTVSAVEHLMPKELYGDVKGMTSYILSEPTDFLTDERVAHFKHQLEMQKDFYEGELTDEEARITRSLMPVFKRQIDGEYVNEDLEQSYLNAIESSQQFRREGYKGPAKKPDTTGQALATPVKGKPQFVMQDGKVFKLDPATGKYKYVPNP